VVNINDELLVAYADGELDAAQAARVERAVSTDPRLQARLAALTRAGELTREVFEAKGHDPVPSALIEAIMSGSDAPPKSADASRRSLRQRLADWWQIPLPAAAFGALALLAVGGLLGYLLPDGTPGEGAITTAGVVPSDSPLHLLLQEQPSGATLAAGRLNLEAVATFVDGDRVCREYSATNETGPYEYHAGIACRDGDAWQVAISVDDYLEQQPAGGFYETASNSLHEAIDRFIDTYIGVDPIDDEAESVLLGRGWRPAE
jgi:hypothetical protein